MENSSTYSGTYDDQKFYNNINDDDKENVPVAAKGFYPGDYGNSATDQPGNSNFFFGFDDYVDSNVGNYDNNLTNDINSTFTPMSNAITQNWQQPLDPLAYAMQSTFGRLSEIDPSSATLSITGYLEYEQMDPSLAVQGMNIPAQQQGNFNQQPEPQYVGGMLMPPLAMVDYRVATPTYQPPQAYGHNFYDQAPMDMHNGSPNYMVAHQQHGADAYNQLVVPYMTTPQELNHYSQGSSAGDSGVGALTDHSYGSGSASGRTRANSVKRKKPKFDAYGETEEFGSAGGQTPADSVKCKRPKFDVYGETEEERKIALNQILHRQVATVSLPQHVVLHGDPYDIYCPVPGRMSLLSAAKIYEVSIAEISRRLNPPEVLNASYLNSILRKAKNKNGGTSMRMHFVKYGLQLPPGRRKSAESSLFTALSEGEATQMAVDFAEIVRACYLASEFCQVLLTDLEDEDIFMMVYMRKVLFNIICEIDEVDFLSLLVQSFANVDNSDYNDMIKLCHSGITRLSRLTHGFGNRVLTSGLKFLLDVLTCMVDAIENNVKCKRYFGEKMLMAQEVIEEQRKFDIEMEAESKRHIVSKGVRMANERRYFQEVALRTGMKRVGPIIDADPVDNNDTCDEMSQNY